MSEKLKPCPFCGHATYRNERDPLQVNAKPSPFFRTICGHCNALGPASDTPQEANEQWDLRPREEQLVKLLREARKHLETDQSETWPIMQAIDAELGRET